MIPFKTQIENLNIFYAECNKKIDLLQSQIVSYVGKKIHNTNGAFAKSFTIDLQNVHSPFQCTARLEVQRNTLRMYLVMAIQGPADCNGVCTAEYYKESLSIGNVDPNGILTYLIDPTKSYTDSSTEPSKVQFRKFNAINYDEQLLIKSKYQSLAKQLEILKSDFRLSDNYLNY